MGDFFCLKTPLSIKIYSSVDSLPKNWNDFAVANIFLSSAYLDVLEQSKPSNMICHFIGLFDKEELVGIAVSQFLNLNQFRETL